MGDRAGSHFFSLIREITKNERKEKIKEKEKLQKNKKVQFFSKI
jgi:hypothetical protein